MPNPPNGHRAVAGPMHAVPCPYCGQPNDFRAHADQDSGSAGWGSTLEAGSKVDCDHCGRTSKILRIDRVPVITLAPA